MHLVRIAFRNVFKNGRRSLITMISIAFGFMAVVIFKGYTHNSYDQITLAAIFFEGPGHFTIYKKGFHEQGRIAPEKYLLDAEDLKKIEGVLKKDPRVLWTAPKLSLSGLVTNGRVSAIFIADSIDPERDASLWNHNGYGIKPRDNVLPPDPPSAALIAPQLAAMLNLGKGGEAVVMCATRQGQMNAADITVGGIYPTITEAMDDKFIKMPLSLARNLYDFDGANRVSVLLGDKALTAAAREETERELASAGLKVETRGWDELSQYYRKVRNYLDVVFLFIFSIVMVIVVMSTTNTMSMAVYERIREIGTLRAIGLKPAGVVRVFAMEGGFLGLFGSLLGSLFALAGVWLLKAADITYSPPAIASKVAVKVDLVPEYFLFSLVFFVFLSIISAALPAVRAARMNIVDALGHV